MCGQPPIDALGGQAASKRSKRCDGSCAGPRLPVYRRKSALGALGAMNASNHVRYLGKINRTGRLGWQVGLPETMK